MKRQIQSVFCILLAMILAVPGFAQDRRTLDTKAADILAQFPAPDFGHADRLAGEMAALGQEGLAKFFALIVPAGTGDDTQARYALSSLSRYAGAPGHENLRDLTEKSFLTALGQASHQEVKAYYIRELAFCGQSPTIAALTPYLETKGLSSPAVATLTTIGTEEAAKAIFTSLKNQSGDSKIELIKAVGTLKYKPAEAFLNEAWKSANAETQLQILTSLAQIGDPASAKLFKQAAEKAGYAADPTAAMVAWFDYARQLARNGDTKLSNSLATAALKKCTKKEQLHFRSAALEILRANQGEASTPLLVKEITNTDKAYRNAVLRIAGKKLSSKESDQWVKVFSKVPAETQAELLFFLAPRQEENILSQIILPSLKSGNPAVRQEAILALAINQKSVAIPTLLDQMKNTGEAADYPVIEESLLTVCSTDDCSQLAADADGMNLDGQAVLVRVLADRRASAHFGLIEKLCGAGDAGLRLTAYEALARMARPDDVEKVLNLLSKAGAPAETEAAQKALISLYQQKNHPESRIILSALASGNQKEKLIPVLPWLNDKNALKSVTTLLKSGSTAEKAAAFKALAGWNGSSALPALYEIFAADNSFRNEALGAYLSQVNRAGIPDDQMLLWLDKIMGKCTTSAEKNQVIAAAGSVKTFLALVFVSKYLDQDDLSAAAAQATMKIALPASGEKNGLTGQIVREALQKAKEKITGNDSQYFKIDIQEYLDKMPAETGYVSIFNGKDLSGWQGLVKNPIERAKMSPRTMEKEQAAANKRMLENWSAKDGAIVFNGKGDNLCSVKSYKDFDLVVDWRITKDGDSGIYLRGTPQVQIWDTARVDVGAQVGSGGLYNNTKNPSKPLVLADNAIGDWNTFRIRMVDQRVTVYLNGQLVVDNVVLENYWDRSIPIFSEGPIELQAHGTDLAFRNIYVREINADSSNLTEEEKAEGFVSLFNGRDMDLWIGNKTDYVPEDGVIAVHPTPGSRGNLYTAKEYSNFILRFEFQLTPGANNGLGVHAPLEGDAAYVGKELQILDNEAPVYAKLQPYQYHGSVYGIIPAKRGFQKPVGEWNTQEVVVTGDHFKVTLNGEVILDGNVKEATKNGTPDHKDHPGLERHTGHIGFLGHGSELKFRNLRIKELK